MVFSGKMEVTMRRPRFSLSLSAVFVLLSCSDPTGPRIPNPEPPGKDDDDNQGVVSTATVKPNLFSTQR